MGRTCIELAILHVVVALLKIFHKLHILLLVVLLLHLLLALRLLLVFFLLLLLVHAGLVEGLVVGDLGEVVDVAIRALHHHGR